MKKLIGTIIFVLAPAVSLAGGHSALGGTGTGKWAALTGAKFQGKTRLRVDGGVVYDIKPVN